MACDTVRDAEPEALANKSRELQYEKSITSE